MAFTPGHKRIGGRTKGTPNKASLPIAETCAFYGCDPLQAMIECLKKPEYRFAAAKELLQYIYPKRKALDITLEHFTLEEIEAFLRVKLAERKE